MTSSRLRAIGRKVPGAAPLYRALRAAPATLGSLAHAFAAGARASPSRPWTYGLLPVDWAATERALLALLRLRIRRRIRHDWYESADTPHFSYSNYNALAFSCFERMPGPGILLRGFLSAEMVRGGDRVLDIGCGDGFFSKRFLAIEAAHVDALDNDPAALAFAQRYNADPKVSFYLLDAVASPFPAAAYDVVVWDGAIGHFAPQALDMMLRKIKAALGTEGVFCGSEQLGRVAAADHLQHWDSLEEVQAMLTPHFRFVAVRAIEYFYDLDRTARRGEFYWRASDSRAALERASFRVIESAEPGAWAASAS